MTVLPPTLVLAMGMAALISWGLVAVLIRLAPRLGLVDQPNDRSLHVRETPRGGGLPVALIATLGVLAAHPGTPASWVFAGTALFVAAISLRDDFSSLSPGLRLLCQAGAGVVGIACLDGFTRISFGFGPLFDLGLLGLPLTFVWIVGLTNAYNFMDGIDGLAGTQGAVTAASWCAAGLLLGFDEVTWIGGLLSAGCLGFLIHNWSPARIFMGDVGSAFLGFAFALLPLVCQAAGPVESEERLPGFAVLAVFPFIADGFYTFLRRAWNREVVWKPHRSHLYQRLVRAGHPHARITFVYLFWALVSAAAAIAHLTASPFSLLLSATAIAILPALVLVTRACEAHARRKGKP